MDTVADMLIQIKNAGNAGLKTAAFPYSDFKFAIANALASSGYVSAVNSRKRKMGREIVVRIAYDGLSPKIQGLKRISKSSRRLYSGARNISAFRQGYGDYFLSTPKGVLSGREAKKQSVGGELLFAIW
jgi:small subunit ribosomal protein S8